MRFLLLFTAAVLTSCTGYQLGGAKPAILRDVNNITVPMFRNDTLHPRAEALATSAATDAVVRDGTYRITSLDKADAILEAPSAPSTTPRSAAPASTPCGRKNSRTPSPSPGP